MDTPPLPDKDLEMLMSLAGWHFQWRYPTHMHNTSELIKDMRYIVCPDATAYAIPRAPNRTPTQMAFGVFMKVTNGTT